MPNDREFWEQSWKRDKGRDFLSYAGAYHRMASPEIDIFRQRRIRTVCDAGCGWGAYALALASNGFEVTAFDVSAAAVELTERLLDRYGLKLAGCRTASVLDTGYPDGAFDAVVCFSVLDHLTVPDAETALRELMRIIRTGGLFLLALDKPDKSDFAREHTILPDGSIRYAGGMVFHPYDPSAAESFLTGLRIIHRSTGPKGEFIAIIEK